MRIIIVWLEEFLDDLDSILPGLYISISSHRTNRSAASKASISILVPEQQSKTRDVSIIAIHPLKNRLIRLSLNSNAQR
jgi:hypothetical protein